MRRFPIILGVVLLFFVSAGLAWWRVGGIAHLGADTIRGSGVIEVKQVEVGFEVGGTIVERLVDEGQVVRVGELIARLDERPYRLQVARATAAKAGAEARYRLLVTGARAQDVDQALAALQATESDLRLKRAGHHRIIALRRSNVVSADEFDRSASALAAAAAARDQARAKLAVLRQGFRTEEVEEAHARLQEAETALEMAEFDLSRCQLSAPVAGRVLTKSREVGEIVQPGAPVVTIGDLTRPWLNLYVGERDLGKVALGMKAEVSADSFPNQPFTGYVSFVADQSEFTPKNIQTPDERVKLVYRVKIELENRRQQLKPGMPADAVLLLDGLPDAPA